MDNKNEKERFFAELAKAYTAEEGITLLNEFANISKGNTLLPTAGLERKIKNKLFHRKIRSFTLKALPFAATFVVALLIFNGLQGYLAKQSPNYDTAPSTTPIAMPAAPPTMASPNPNLAREHSLLENVALVSANLPAGYEVTGVDYDNMAAVMAIENKAANRIILTLEEYTDFDTTGFSIIEVNGDMAYGLVKQDYCVLKYSKDDMLYTLTSLYDYGDLIEIIENI